MFGISGRYAQALYMAAAKRNQLSTVEQEMATLGAAAARSAAFHDFLVNPIYQRADKRAGLAAALTAAKFSDVMLNFIGGPAGAPPHCMPPAPR